MEVATCLNQFHATGLVLYSVKMFSGGIEREEWYDMANFLTETLQPTNCNLTLLLRLNF